MGSGLSLLRSLRANEDLGAQKVNDPSANRSMRKLYAVAVICTMLLALSACDKNSPASPEGKQSKSPTQAIEPIVLQDWGPKETRAGEAFNRQPTNNSAIWIKVSGVKRHPDTKVTWSGSTLAGVAVGADAVTAEVPPELFQREGQYEIVIEEGDGGRKFSVGKFVVNPK